MEETAHDGLVKGEINIYLLWSLLSVARYLSPLCNHITMVIYTPICSVNDTIPDVLPVDRISVSEAPAAFHKSFLLLCMMGGRDIRDFPVQVSVYNPCLQLSPSLRKKLSNASAHEENPRNQHGYIAATNHLLQ